ncbi:MAG: hypothetical protein ACD_16C00100G0080 [uncultured bacterium]|nr:MAG: hypothetical protein ACD_16C00100G0080 [uncultured bacterium]OFW68055.1 MAG: nucleotidyltransferase [Alphaproteobacteria bacterium GWC2_42_16]OFW73447.1 MAG: nucleotidyltransferase [Alphaproteobacteria bacterium GWA2_41_27]OFW82296.1 MAG: nucleotidyltransferase [Alphaproteobacteria bacterium RIFCSPHIGHO2_12_FULL_42_100]OFW86122.1 MAG: nucleotidyltransferase [Alphaproteobacteria bacterium RBG_16_42_14]OFW91681.1 MAG: nucleotidyltransferase [Alphaproteobacteria bacterium RIFCSPHIGHO2_02_
MRPSIAFESHRKAIRRIVEENHARNARIFGSVLHGDDRENSDLDLLIDPIQDTTLMDIARIQNQLQVLLGVPVDVLTPKALPEQFRDEILKEAKLI